MRASAPIWGSLLQRNRRPSRAARIDLGSISAQLVGTRFLNTEITRLCGPPTISALEVQGFEATTQRPSEKMLPAHAAVGTGPGRYNTSEDKQMTMTLIEALHHRAKSRPESVAFYIGEDVWTYQRLSDEVERLARGLVGRGLGKGSRVALHMANVPEFAVAVCACFQIGAIAAPLNIRLKSAELRPLLQRLLPALYMGQADLYRHVAATDTSIVPWNARFIVGDAVDDPWTQGLTRLLENGVAGPVKAEPEADAPALLLITSGTTGQPKFVTHTQATLTAIIEFASHPGNRWRPDGSHLLAPGPRVRAISLPGMSAVRRAGRLAGAL